VITIALSFPLVMQIYFKGIKEVGGGGRSVFLFLKVVSIYASFLPCSATGCGCTECESKKCDAVSRTEKCLEVIIFNLLKCTFINLG